MCREEFWKKNDYTSTNISLDSEGESEEEEDEEEEEEEDNAQKRDINYVVGDVTHPQHTDCSDAIIVHCVGKCIGRA